MPRSASRQPALPDLIDLAAQMQRDEGRQRAWLWRRDREIGQSLAPLRRRPAAQVVAWLDQVTSPADRIVGTRAAHAQRLVVLVLAALGFVVGWATAAVVFYYTGDRPVNVVAVLAVFVFLQALLLALFLVAALPNRLLRGVPGAEATMQSLRLLSPGRLAPLITRLLPQSQREAVAVAIGRSDAHQIRFAGVQKWSALAWSQVFAVAFNVAALLRYLYLVFFSDLAFVWSTTLQTDATVFHRIVRALAWPWAWAVADATPSYDLVQATRYFRLEEGALPEMSAAGDAVDPSYFGGWWPFLLMCLLVYGLLPRVATLALATWRMRRAVSLAVLHTPGVSALRDRLNSEYVQTQSPETPDPTEAATAAEANAPSSPGDPAAGLLRRPRARVIVNWSGVPLPVEDVRSLAGDASTPVLDAGGSRSLDEDRQTIEQVAKTTGAGAVMVVVKGWEPPVLDLLDFLADLREALGAGDPIVVMPVWLESSQQAVHPVHLAQWRRKLAAVGDPWLAVATVEGELAS